MEKIVSKSLNTLQYDPRNFFINNIQGPSRGTRYLLEKGLGPIPNGWNKFGSDLK